MALTKEQKELEDMLAQQNEHINEQAFGGDASTAIYETIDTPGVSIAGKIGCLITACCVYVQALGVAAVTTMHRWTTQLAGGTQTGLVAISSNHFIAMRDLYGWTTAAGVSGVTSWPLTIDNPTYPMLVVNPKMTIWHRASNAPDFNSKTVVTCFNYVNVEMSLEVHQSLLNSQMNLT